MLKRLLKNSDGNVAIIFGLAALPLVVASGGVVDYSRAFDQRTTVQDALDSAALAAARKLGLLSEGQLDTEAQAYYNTNIGTKLADIPPMTVSVSGATLTATTTLEVPTNFLGIIGLDEIIFDLSSSVTSGIGTLEVAMVLDNSTSMAGTKIATLITAATDLTTTLYGLGTASTKPDPVKVGIAPFAAAVNVGPENKTAAWMDTGALATQHADAMDGTATTINNFTLLADMSNQAWAGCVEERKIPYDATDDLATSGDTLFVPMFAADEPDIWTCTSGSIGGCSCSGSGSNFACSGAPTGSRNYNNYIKDNTGNCTSNADTAKTKASTETAAFQRKCKYKNQTPANISVRVGSGISFPGGPNFMCTTKAVTPLTTSTSTVTAAIGGMAANGTTNILGGVMWGWRLLSPTAPFTEGRSYADDENQKILILMTDGENTYFPHSKPLTKSYYGAWGYIAKGHVGTTSTSTTTIVGKMNGRVATACENIKAVGVKIYTVAFQVDDDDTLDLLEDCASSKEMAFQSSSSAALVTAFTAIGDDISSLRISK